MQTSDAEPVEAPMATLDPLFAPPTLHEALLGLEESAMACVPIIQQKHAAQTTALRELRTLRRCLGPMTALALRLPAERGPVVALLRAFIGACQWETRAAQQQGRDPVACIALTIAGQAQLARLAIAESQERARTHKQTARRERSAPPPTPLAAPMRAPQMARHKRRR